MTGMFQVTAEFSNAVLLAILPHINGVAKSPELAAPHLVTTNDVRQFRCDPREGHLGGVVFLKNHFTFWFDRGIVYGVESPHCYFRLQDPDEIPKFYGHLECSRDEAVRIGLRAIASLGHDVSKLKSIKPSVEGPTKVGTNVVPHFRISWPHGNSPAAEVEVNAEKRRVEMLWLYSDEFSRPPPMVSVARPAQPKRTNVFDGGIQLQAVNTERQRDILKSVLPQIAAFAKRLELPMPPELTTNSLTNIQCGLLRGEPHVEVTLTNGYRFAYTWGYVSSFYGPNCFFTYDWKQRGKTAKDFLGPVPPSLQPLEDAARRAVKSTGHFKDEQFLEQKPIFAGGPDMTNKVDLTRFFFVWHVPNRLTAREKDEIPSEMWPQAAVEVDSKTLTVQSLFILDPKR